MPIALQERLIQWILSPLSRTMEKVPERIRNTAFSLSVLGITLMEFARESGLYTGRFLYQYIIAYGLFGIMILVGLTPELKPTHFSPVLTVCWFGIAVFMVSTGLLVNTDALADAVLWVGALPVLYLVWNGRNFERMVPLVIRGVLFSFLFFAVVSIFFFPINTVNYGSFFANRNRTSLYLVAVFVCIFIYILPAKKYSLRVFLADILLGFVAATIYYTNCRTGMVSTALCFICTSLFQLYLHWKDWRRVFLVQLLPIAAATVLLVPSAIYIYHGGYQLKTSIQAIFTSPGEEPVPNDPVEPAPVEPAPVEPPSVVLDTMNDYNDQRFNTADKNLNDYTAGRAELWRIHLEQVGFLGNPPGKVLYRADGAVEGRSAHFTIIQFSYDFGALAGIFLLAFNLLAGLASIRYAIKRRELKYALWPFAVAIIFGGNSVMEAIGHPAQCVLDLLYFLSLTPLVAMPSSIPKSQQKTKKVLYIMYVTLNHTSSGSGIRPAAMYQAFLERGYDVYLLSGYCGRGEGTQRRAEVRKAIAWLRENRPDFCYIESSTYPIMYHCDYDLIRLLHLEDIPTAYFYRDFYRRFPNLFPRRKGFLNKLKETYLDFLQWRTDRVLQNMDIVYFPSNACFHYFSYRCMKTLPPAGRPSSVSLNDTFTSGHNQTSIYVGGVSTVYGTPLLLDAFSLLNKNGVKYPLILVCREGEFEETFPNSDIPPWLEIYHASGKELEPLYARSSLGLLTLSPNEYTQLAVGTKLFQYISYGLPVLSTDTAAMKSLIEENKFGRTAPYDASAFAAAAKEMLDHPKILFNYRKSALKSLQEKHLWVHRVDQIASDLLRFENGGNQKGTT